MKKILIHSVIPLSLIFLASGCDVTSDGTGGSSSESDPAVVDKPVAYIQRPVPFGLADDDDIQISVLPEDVQEPSEFRPGAVLMLKGRATVTASARALTTGAFPEVMDEEGELSEALYDVRDLTSNIDGTKLAFSMHAPMDETLDDDDPGQPTWNIWEYDTELDTLSRIIDSNTEAEKGHDRYPTYLGDESIIFSSTRQANSKKLLLDLNGSGFTYVTERDDESRAFTLHRINPDRDDIIQISYGKGHDIQPTILDDGRVLFLRGDDTSNTNDDRLSLYTMNPDGSNVSLHYGFHSPSSLDGEVQGALIKPQEMPETGEILVNYQPRVTRALGGDIYTIDTQNYIDITQPTSVNLGLSGPAEQSLSFGDVVLEEQSPHGTFNSAYPLKDNSGRLLVSWMPCLVQGYRLDIYVRQVDTEITDEDDLVIGLDSRYELINVDGDLVDEDGDNLGVNATPVEVAFEDLNSFPCTNETFDNAFILPAEPQFGVWVYDPNEESFSPVVLANEAGTLYTEAIILESRDRPTSIPDTGAESEAVRDIADEQVGIIHIRSVYDFDGIDTVGIARMADSQQTPVDSRPIRFVRFLSEANMPHEDDLDIDEGLIRGRNGRPSRSIIGYAEVHPDGSVMAKVPADTAFTIDLVDANGRRVSGANPAHRYWLNVRPGETRTCNGCHTPGSTSPHGREDAEPESANPGANGAAPFLNTILRDTSNGSYTDIPNDGDTMAEYYVRSRLADPSQTDDPLALSLDLIYEDEWSNPLSVPAENIGTAIEIKFGDPENLGPDNLSTAPPVFLGACLTGWEYRCRTVIDYPDHIQPIFEVVRLRTDEDTGLEISIACTNCHSVTDPDGVAQIPAPASENLQLDFRNIISPLDNDMVFLKGYDEFFAAGDLLLEIEDGVIRTRQIPLRGDDNEIQYQPRTTPRLDENGNSLIEFLDLNGDTQCLADNTVDPDLSQVLDDNDAVVPCPRFLCILEDDVEVFDAQGNCVERRPILVNDEQGRYLSAGAANANQNQRFFNIFDTGGAHEGYLSPAEIKLFSEWLDMGGQYYNDIFKAIDD